jgi:hypothetical protein
MKVTAKYQRKLCTSRRFVFENVFDLEHVCVVHRRWFRNLRVRVQRPDYVEYLLTSWFYGLEQETLVRGAPIDADRYWYEFLTPLARMRVEGVMEGSDGDLILKETITYNFHWLLAPFFWGLRPLFSRQKDDILRADSGLLERVYELDQRGFRRRELGGPKVVVYGGDGFFGRLVVEDLLQNSDARIVIASRHPKTNRLPFSPRLKFVQSDLNNPAAVRETINATRVVINCTGPFQSASPSLLRACIEKRVDYVDVADDRAFVEACYALRGPIEKAGIRTLIGCSVVPGLSTLLCAMLREQIPQFVTTKICISPGTRRPRGSGSFLCLLSTVGQTYEIPAAGGPRTVTGWTGREAVMFPAAMGRRSGYLVVDIPDYFTQRVYFNTPNVEFRIGSELAVLNKALSAIRWTREHLGIPKGRWFLVPARALIHLAAPFGTTQGGVMVEVSGKDTVGQPTTRALCVYAPERGEVIPAILPSLAAQMILSGEIKQTGIAPLTNWISADRLLVELAKRNIQVASRKGNTGAWTACTLSPEESSTLPERS